MTVRRSRIVVAAVITTLACATRAADAAGPVSADPIDRGRYVVSIAGCNDCHTPGYAISDGKVPEKDWLTGDRLGWRGPWGTTYAPNLRRFIQTLSEAQWLKLARTSEFRPPMPSWSLHHMTDADLSAVYRYIRHLGPAGSEAPAYLPPDREPAPPYVQFPAPPK